VPIYTAWLRYSHPDSNNSRMFVTVRSPALYHGLCLVRVRGPQNKGLNILGANKTYSRGRSRKLWFYNYELALTNNNIKKMAKFSEARRNALVWLQLLYSSVNNPQNQCEEATKKRIEEKELQLQRVLPFQGWHSWGRRMTVYLSQKAESKPNYIFSERTYPNLANWNWFMGKSATILYVYSSF